jgi:aminopeptidase N
LLYRLVILGAAGKAETAAEPPVPDPVGKARAWHTIIIIDDDGFFHPEHAELTAPCVARYFTEMPAMAARRTPTPCTRWRYPRTRTMRPPPRP